MGDWFERLTGFVEDGYEPTQRRLSVEGDELVSSVNGKRYGVGSLTVPTLASLREQVSVSRGDNALRLMRWSAMRGRCTPIRASRARCFKWRHSSICWR